jgi:hypothetical protein
MNAENVKLDDLRISKALSSALSAPPILLPMCQDRVHASHAIPTSFQMKEQLVALSTVFALRASVGMDNYVSTVLLAESLQRTLSFWMLQLNARDVPKELPSLQLEEHSVNNVQQEDINQNWDQLVVCHVMSTFTILPKVNECAYLFSHLDSLMAQEPLLAVFPMLQHLPQALLSAQPVLFQMVPLVSGVLLVKSIKLLVAQFVFHALWEDGLAKVQLLAMNV